MRFIDADALIYALETQDYSGSPESLEDWTPQDLTKVEIADIKNAPTIDAELVRHGKWLMSDVYGAYCSECGSAAFEITGSQYSKMKTRYCWQCGARMDAE